MSRKLDGTGITINCLHPGNVNTPLIQSFPNFMLFLAPLFTITPKKAAKNLVYLTVSKDLECVSGQYFKSRSIKNFPKSVLDKDLAKKLWLWSVSYTNNNFLLLD